MGGGVNRTPPLYFRQHSSDWLDIWHFQLIETTCCLIGFHGNHSNIITSLAAAILDFQIFKIFSNSNLNTENSEKTTLSD